MASKQGGLLVTLGKRILGFNTSSTGCCAGPVATAETKAPAATCCAAEAAPADAKSARSGN